MIHTTVHWRTARRFLAGVAAGAVLAGTSIGYATRADAAPKFCDTQMYIHACAVGHGDAAVPAKKKDKDCAHETPGGEPVGSGVAGGAA